MFSGVQKAWKIVTSILATVNTRSRRTDTRTATSPAAPVPEREGAMIATVPWWTWLLPLGRPLLNLLFVALSGIIQRRATGTWPNLMDWCAAISALRPFPGPQPQTSNGNDNSVQTRSQLGDRHVDNRPGRQ